MNVQSVLDYSAAHGGRACVIMQNSAVIGQNGITTTWDLQSGSKSFCGPLALKMRDEGLISSLDDKFSDTISEWFGASAQKKACSVRRGMCLTGGLNPGATGGKPTYAQSIGALMPIGDVGDMKYGPNIFGVYGEFVNRKVKPLGFTDNFDYLQQKILLPLGITATVDRLPDGNPHLAGGIRLNCLDWAKYGEYLRLGNFTELTGPGPDYVAYGFNFWRWIGDSAKLVAGNLAGSAPMQGGGYSAAGDGNQRLIIYPDLGIVCARFGVDNSTYSDIEMETRLRA